VSQGDCTQYAMQLWFLFMNLPSQHDALMHLDRHRCLQAGYQGVPIPGSPNRLHMRTSASTSRAPSLAGCAPCPAGPVPAGLSTLACSRLGCTQCAPTLAPHSTGCWTL
jgi:hypothetical protein